MAQITAQMVKTLREQTGAGMMDCKKALEEVDGNLEEAVTLLRKKGEAKAGKRADKTAAEGRVVIALNDAETEAVMLEVNCETDFVAKDENFVAFAGHVVSRAMQEGLDSLDALMALPYEAGQESSVEKVRESLVAKIGENIKIRRFADMKASGYVGHYIHSNQRIGVLVALREKNETLARDVAMHVAASAPKALSSDEVPQELIATEKEIFTAQAIESGKPADIAEKMVVGRINKFLKEVSLLDQPFVKDPSQTIAELVKANNNEIEAFVRFEVGEGIEVVKEDFAAEVMKQVEAS